MSFPKLFLNKKYLIAILIFLIVAFGTTWKAGQRIADDERIWVPAGVRFIDALRAGNPAGTHVSNRPGVTVSWVSGITTSLAERFNNTEVIRGRIHTFIAPQGYTINRVVFGLLTAVFTAIVYLALARLLSWKKAAVIAVFIGVHPLTIFKSESVWTDLFLAFFMLLSLIFYLIYWKENKKVFLIAAGVLFGLSIATKTIGVVLIPTFFLASLWPKLSRKTTAKAVTSTSVIALIGFLTFYLIYPYLWQHPLGFLERYAELSQEIATVKEVGGAFSLLYYPGVFFKADPILLVGCLLSFGLLTIQFLKGIRIPFELILVATATLLYISVLVFVSQFNYLNGQKIASARYIIPAVYLMIFFLIDSVSFLTKGRFSALWLFPAAAFLLNLYNILYFFPCEINRC
jgi:4-amino-4-deoxy-L-arabinose transferase-like glycosyltransferase